ncbi:DUF2878 family protein [Candidatus Micrarchaeota archaeon]|nr:DUF2878 family protein [Candidatus Micrarchaeota archaeon]
MKELLEYAKLILPLLIIPLTLQGVLMFGHSAADGIIGICFFIGAISIAKTQTERRFMITLAIFAMLFETANVAIGIYKYIDTIQVPVWVAIGWGVLGIYIVRNLETLKKINDRTAYILSGILFFGIWAGQGFQLSGTSSIIHTIIGVLTIFVLSRSSSYPSAYFFFIALMGVIIEFSGTTFGVWTYFDPATKIAILPPLAGLGMAYASVLAFCMWISKLE